MSKIFFNLPLSIILGNLVISSGSCCFKRFPNCRGITKSYVSHSARSTCTLTFKSVRGWHLTGYLRVCKHNFVPAIMSVFYGKYIPTRWYSAAKAQNCLFTSFTSPQRLERSEFSWISHDFPISRRLTALKWLILKP